MLNIAVNCPECGGVSTLNVYRENDGADEVGRRGAMRTFVEVATPCPSECEWTDEQFEAVEDIAIENVNARWNGHCTS